MLAYITSALNLPDDTIFSRYYFTNIYWHVNMIKVCSLTEETDLKIE